MPLAPPLAVADPVLKTDVGQGGHAALIMLPKKVGAV
jgi:hypothetical protein